MLNEQRARMLARLNPGRMRELILGFSEIGSASAGPRIAAEWYAGCLRACGAAYVQIVGDTLESPTVVAGFPGLRRRPILQFVGRWHSVPFQPARLVDGRVVGRGLLRGMAELIAVTEVARALTQEGVLPGGGLLLVAQSGSNAHPADLGALSNLIARGVVGDAVVLAGGEHAVAPICTRGAATFRVSFGGHGQHADAATTDGAALEAAHTLTVLLRRRARCAARRVPGSAETIVVRRVDGGTPFDSDESMCVVEGGWQWAPGRSVDDVSHTLEEMVDCATRRFGVGADVRVTPLQEPTVLSPHSTLVQSLRDAHLRVAGWTLPLGTSGRPDSAPLFLRAGVPALGYGMAASHSDGGEEVVEVEELARLARIYIHLALSYLLADYVSPCNAQDAPGWAQVMQAGAPPLPRAGQAVAPLAPEPWLAEEASRPGGTTPAAPTSRP